MRKQKLIPIRGGSTESGKNEALGEAAQLQRNGLAKSGISRDQLTRQGRKPQREKHTGARRRGNVGRSGGGMRGENTQKEGRRRRADEKGERIRLVRQDRDRDRGAQEGTKTLIKMSEKVEGGEISITEDLGESGTAL